MAARLEALLTSQQLLFRNVSHELRSPLARVQVALGLLRQHTGTEAARYLERINREVGRLNRLIGQMLTLARLESGVEVAQGEVCDLRALVQEVVADGDFEAQARQSAVTLVSAEACRVAGTTELLRSAIENVVRNAVRYTTAGTTTEVRVSGHATPAGHPTPSLRSATTDRGCPGRRWRISASRSTASRRRVCPSPMERAWAWRLRRAWCSCTGAPSRRPMPQEAVCG